MRHFLNLLLLAAVLVAPAYAQRDIGSVDVNINSQTIKVRVSVTGGTAALDSLARKAFGTHGRYELAESGYRYDIRLVVQGTQVRAEVLQGTPAAVVASETFSGTSIANALLRAGDFAVEKTNGQGLKGYFTSRLAFVGEAGGRKEIYTSDLFFTQGAVRQETNDRTQALMPRWAPDGRSLVYTSYLKGVPDIYRIDLDARRRDELVSVQGTNIAGPFSPDGRRMLAVLTGTGRSEIYVRDMQTGKLDALTRIEAVKSSPVWSPDGSRIIFAMSPGPQLFVMQAVPGSTPQRIGTQSNLANEPAWSRANPNKVAFTFQEGPLNRIGVVDLATREVVQASPPRIYGSSPSWLPDGRHLVYTVQMGARSRLHILDTVTFRSTVISAAEVEPASQASVWAP